MKKKSLFFNKKATFKNLRGHIYFMKNMRLLDVSIHVYFHQYQYIKKYASENLANIQQSHGPVVFCDV